MAYAWFDEGEADPPPPTRESVTAGLEDWRLRLAGLFDLMAAWLPAGQGFEVKTGELPHHEPIMRKVGLAEPALLPAMVITRRKTPEGPGTRAPLGLATSLTFQTSAVWVTGARGAVLARGANGRCEIVDFAVDAPPQWMILPTRDPIHLHSFTEQEFLLLLEQLL